MPQGGRLRIRTSATTLSEGLLHAGGMIPPGRYCVLSVADEGTGMPPEVLSRIFEPFFTTKGGTRGTGLGLSTVYGIVEQLGGHLVVQSAPGRGSSFELYLPMLEATATVMVQRPMGVALGDEVILVVEDLGAIRSLAQRTLSRAGYRVVTAESGEEARMAGRRAPRIDLIVMDVMLPGERGPAVARELKELHPAARIIYVSGNLGMREEDSSPDGQQWFLQKPFSPEQLLSIVRTALDAPVQSGVAPETPRT
ncbi:MAG TPA: ATP-binding protein, partial [Gemmatimonadales bacterium]|nr:ATP-binding protein [Gemmatimonadales bacterium]